MMHTQDAEAERLSDADLRRLTPSEALDEARRLAGSQQGLADICGCTQGNISHMMLRADRRLSHQYVLAVEAALGIPRWVLRPDIYPPEGR